jgi:peptide/nickel transport system ATP-binding protein
MNLLPRVGVTRTGEILFEGRDLLTLSDAEMRPLLGAEMGMIFQDPMTSLHPVQKIGKQIGESIRLHLNVSRSEAKQRALELLQSVKIPEPARRLDEYPHQLSGGMRQRVMVAIAIACDPKLLIADEPTTSLDVTVQAQILDLLAEKQRERHMAMILVSHDLGVVASRADEIAVMYAGKIVEKAPTMALFADTRMPYTQALLESIPALDHDPDQRLRVIRGRPPDLRDPPTGCRFAPRCPKAQPRCEAEEPPLVAADAPGHEFACWYPVKGSDPSPDAAGGRTARLTPPRGVKE